MKDWITLRERLQEAEKRIADLEKQLALYESNCAGCGNPLHTRTFCLECGYDEQEKRIEHLEAELAKWKLVWQTGKPQEDGDYWFEMSSGERHIFTWNCLNEAFCIGDSWVPIYKGQRFAGPIPQPADKEDGDG